MAEKKFVAHVSPVSAVFLYIHLDIPFQSTILPYVSVVKAQDMRNSALASISLATWPSQMQTRVMSPKFDNITFVDNDTMLIDFPDFDDISVFSKNTRENTGTARCSYNV